MADQVKSKNEYEIPSGKNESNPDLPVQSSAKRDRDVPKRSKKYSLLLVDDEEYILKSQSRLFRRTGYKVFTADNGHTALDILNANYIDLVICDYRMPEMTGTELLKVIKNKYPRVLRLMLTAFADTKAVKQAVDEGIIYKFITKPWNDDDLELDVRLALEQNELIRENDKLKEYARQSQSEINRLKKITGLDRSTLGNILIARGIITPAQLEMAERYKQQNNTLLVKALLELEMCKERHLLKIIQDESRVDYINLGEMVLEKDLNKVFSRDVCESCFFIPIKVDGSSLHIAMADPLDLSRRESIAFTTQKNVIPYLSSIKDINKAIKYLYSRADLEHITELDKIDYLDTLEDIDVLLDEEEVETAEQLMAKSSSPSAVNMINTILADAIRTGASDIHIEPRPKFTLVRYRVDGLLQNRLKIPSEMHSTTISRIKILAKMDIAERRIPQDGRITIKSRHGLVDMRISTIPTINGEKIVCRLLDKNSSVRSLESTGLSGNPLNQLRRIIQSPQGMIIATGPTGSGKTTTLYSLIKERVNPSQNLVTIEDPVEYFMENATQVQVQSKIGLTFPSTLRTTLRQDPDIILLGEIRDLETGEVAFQAAMTGHLVFTTLHTNSTIATISRLIHLGIEPYLVASAVQSIFAQRLVRTICPECKVQSEYDETVAELLGLKQEELPENTYIGRGCENCNFTGYTGRTGLFEVFPLTQEFRQFLTSEYKESELKKMTQKLGMKTLLDDGLEKLKNGITTLEELLRILGPTL